MLTRSHLGTLDTNWAPWQPRINPARFRRTQTTESSTKRFTCNGKRRAVRKTRSRYSARFTQMKTQVLLQEETFFKVKIRFSCAGCLFRRSLNHNDKCHWLLSLPNNLKHFIFLLFASSSYLLPPYDTTPWSFPLEPASALPEFCWLSGSQQIRGSVI